MRASFIRYWSLQKYYAVWSYSACHSELRRDKSIHNYPYKNFRDLDVFSLWHTFQYLWFSISYVMIRARWCDDTWFWKTVISIHEILQFLFHPNALNFFRWHNIISSSDLLIKLSIVDFVNRDLIQSFMMIFFLKNIVWIAHKYLVWHDV